MNEENEQKNNQGLPTLSLIGSLFAGAFGVQTKKIVTGTSSKENSIISSSVE